MTVHQFLPSLSPHDAIGNHVLALRDVLRARWPESWVYADHFPVAEMHEEVEHYLQYPSRARPGDVFLYHASIDSSMSAWLTARPEPLAVIYHNVTPGEFFDPYDPLLAARLRLARRQISALAPRTSLAFGVSRYNADELRDWGFPEPSVTPVHFDPSRHRGPVDTRLLALLRAEKGADPGILFPGRLVPNKAQHDLLRAYRVVLERRPRARLWCPGLPLSPTYVAALGRYRAPLGIPVGCLPGQVTDAEYRA